MSLHMRYSNCMASRRRCREAPRSRDEGNAPATDRAPFLHRSCGRAGRQPAARAHAYARVIDAGRTRKRRRRYEQSLVVALPAVVHASAATVRARQP